MSPIEHPSSIRELKEKSQRLEEINRALLQQIAEHSELASTQTAILDALVAEIALIDAEGRIVAVNESWRSFGRANGLAASEYSVGYNYLKICDSAKGEFSQDAYLAAAGIREVLGGDKRKYVLEYACHSVTEKRWFRMTVTPLKTERLVGAVIVHLEITARKAAEEEKGRLEGELFQAQKMESIGRLAGGVAHDFNNMLTVINGYASIALTKLLADDPLRSSIAEIGKAGERAAALTRQLLAFSRKQVLRPQPLDLNRVVSDLLPMIERLVGEEIEVSWVRAEGRAMVNADLHQLEQVIINLSVNARDAMRRRGRLLFETAALQKMAAGDYVTLRVTDSGAGMSKDTCQRIFEPFFTTKEAGQGTGLGLSTVQGIVEQSGGYIEVSSELGKGAAFTIYLPMLADVSEDLPEPEITSEGGQETVLVVEDLAEVRRYTVAALKAYGYQVIEASTAVEALAICERKQGELQLVLADVIMPKMGGRALANQLSKTWPDVKVLFMSGYVDDALTTMLAGNVNFIPKPFTPEELARRVRTVLGKQKTARILVVDDEAAVRRYLRAVLLQGGFEVVEAQDGRDAVRIVREGEVNLVITDLFMPGQEGLETIQVLHKEAPGVGLIAVSGAFGGRFLKVARLLGAATVLAKPVSASELLKSVEEVLQAQRIKS